MTKDGATEAQDMANHFPQIFRLRYSPKPEPEIRDFRMNEALHKCKQKRDGSGKRTRAYG